ENMPAIGRQLPLEIDLGNIEQEKVVPADPEAVAKIKRDDGYLVKQMHRTPGKVCEQTQGRQHIPGTQSSQKRSRMPRRKWGGVHHKQVVFAAPELEQAPDKPDRSESSLDGTEPSESPAQIATQPNAGPVEFGLCRHSQ